MGISSNQGNYFSVQERKDEVSEIGYFTPLQFADMVQWIESRRSYRLRIFIEGNLYHTKEKFNLNALIIPKIPEISVKAIILQNLTLKINDYLTDDPFLLEITKEVLKSHRIRGIKSRIEFTSFRIINDFSKFRKKRMAITDRQFLQAVNYYDRYLNDWHIRVYTMGNLLEAGIPYPVLLQGTIESQKKYKKRIYVKDFIIIKDIFKKDEENLPKFKNIKIPIFLKHRRIRDYNYYAFEPRILMYVLDEPRAQKQNIISVKELSVSYGKRKILDNVNMDIKHGSIIGIIGESGAGKSTTVKALLAQIKYKGFISIMGINAQETKRLSPHFGYVPQDLTMIYQEFNALENMIYFGTQYNLDEREITQRSKKILKDLKMGPYMDIPVNELSGGQKRRVSIAVALVHNPSILILDEPTSGLDPMTRFSLWQFLDQINKFFGITLIVISHYLDEIEYSDKSAIYMKGVGFFDFDSPANLKQKIPGKGKAIEITLKSITLNVHEILEQISHVDAVIQRGERVRVISDYDLLELSAIIKYKLQENNIEVIKINSGIEIDIMDYFTYYSRKIGSGQQFTLEEEVSE